MAPTLSQFFNFSYRNFIVPIQPEFTLKLISNAQIARD
ncbi:hypothetical protein ADICYQ_3864 [Cyclobacterium qasimii M12-11B]|uniref:Uncharacterized protein n=1 Tax=Cyclobacterium qasimii M12-11B TaxID=641524 RepID=S7WJU9_9BACT|nr:hypothetical protein ADICYQ_3864 [Cyclobacterium qasimii M12-11B]